MATISELMEGGRPGEVRITCRGEVNPHWWFEPYFEVGGMWYGKTPEKTVAAYANGGWEIYTEPKKKVKWVEYLVTPTNPASGTTPYTAWFREEQNKSLYTCVTTKTGRTVEVEGE